MCATDFFYVLVGEDKMILCRKVDFNEATIQKVIRKAFPELLTGPLFLLGLRKVKTQIEGCYKMFSSYFDKQVRIQEEGNDWDKYPFVALFIDKYCGHNCCKVQELFEREKENAIA